MRPIDAYALNNALVSCYNDTGNEMEKAILRRVMQMVVHAPTLTPTNEAPPCYQPDGDGCAYQCYDGDDEPIDKCKECPLCYSDKQRHHTPPNEPLTLEELRGMKDEPAYLNIFNPLLKSGWHIIKAVTKDKIIFRGWEKVYVPIDGMGVGYNLYRRPPEGEADGE